MAVACPTSKEICPKEFGQGTIELRVWGLKACAFYIYNTGGRWTASSSAFVHRSN